MKRLASYLLLSFGLAIYAVVLLYLAWERRTSPWHRSQPMNRQHPPTVPDEDENVRI